MRFVMGAVRVFGRKQAGQDAAARQPGRGAWKHDRGGGRGADPGGGGASAASRTHVQAPTATHAHTNCPIPV